jgi:hypothetical protein
VSVLAAGEASQRRPGWRVWAPAAAGIAALLALAILALALPETGSVSPWVSMYLLAWMSARLVYFGGVLRGRPRPGLVPQVVGQLLKGLLLVQAALAAGLVSGQAGLVALACLFVLFPISTLLGKWFYAS